MSERKTRIFNLKMKFETVQGRMKQEGEEQKSQAYYVLKAAQAKEELQRKGDELDSDIKKAEKEVRALENTYNHLVQRNEKYKAGFKTADSLNAIEADQKLVLEEQNQAANDVLYKKKRQLQQLEYDADVDGQRLSEVQAQGERLDQEIRNLMVTKEELDNVLQTLQQRLSFEEEKNADSKAKATVA